MWFLDYSSRLQNTKGILMHAKGILMHAKGILMHAKGILMHAKGILMHTPQTQLPHWLHSLHGQKICNMKHTTYKMQHATLVAQLARPCAQSLQGPVPKACKALCPKLARPCAQSLQGKAQHLLPS